jgi:hypothetical protein
VPDAATLRRVLPAALAACLAAPAARADERTLWLRVEGSTAVAPARAVTATPTAPPVDRHGDEARAALARAREQFLAYAFREASGTLRLAAAEHVEHLVGGDRALALEVLYWAGACALLAGDRDGARELFRRALTVDGAARPPASVFPPEVDGFFEETRRASALAAPTVRTVRSVPAGARIEVDGRDEGVTPVTLRLAAGVHTLRLTRVGYRPWMGPLRSEGPEVSEQAVVLAEATGAELRAQLGAAAGLADTPDAPTLARILREYQVDRVVLSLRDGTELAYPPRQPFPWAWAAVGAGVAAVGAGLGLYFALRPPETVTLIAP